MTNRQLRLLRASAASAVATVVAAVSHTFAGGAAPHPLLVVSVAVFLLPLAAVLIGIRPSRARTMLTVLVSQALFHALFQLLGAPTSAAPGPSGGHTHQLPALGPLIPAALPDAAMLAGHLLAAAVTVALFWRGESTVRTIASWVRALLRRPVRAVPASHPRPSAPAHDPHPTIHAVVTASVSRRGPPVFA